MMIFMNCLQWSITGLFLLIGGALSIMPEVSQEGLLQPFLTYSDVSLFHYHVPPEVERVTWEFAAFMDDPGCPVRRVHVLVQHGSYPVFSTFNGTFPSYMYNMRSSLQKVITETAFQPHDATLLSVYNPLPGSWFAAAYIPDWNEQMQQAGLIHKCRYSLGSVAMWTQKERITTLNIGAPQTVSTHENLSYFRFYVPSHTWLLHVNISDCTIREKSSSIHMEDGRWCIRSAALSARALPHYSPDEIGVHNISESYLFTERHPYADSYYYLLLFTEGETEATITITTTECGGLVKKTPHPSHRHTRSPIVIKAFNVSENSVSFVVNNKSSSSQIELIEENGKVSFTSSEGSDIGNEELGIDGNNSTLSNLWSDVSSGFLLENEGESTSKDGFLYDQGCFPVLPLARIKHSRDFTDTFLVQGPEWYSTWVSMHGETPVFTHMTLLPFTDIGGTLSITLHMDEHLMNVTNQLISVNGCVKKGRPPLVNSDSLECEKELSLNITSANSKSVKDFLLIPFPEPDTWYLALHVVCYHKGVRSPCHISQVMVNIDVQTQPCVYTGEQPCGTHGVCQETHRGMFFFSSCICEEGWRGWGCHDGKQAKGWTSFVSGICLLTLSNVFFIPSILLAAKRRLYPQTLLFTATMVASVLYHACDSEIYSYCFTRFEVLQFTDFFFSLLCFWVTVVSLGCCVGEELKPTLQFLGVVIIAPAVQYSRTGLLSFLIPMAIAAVIPTVQIFYFRRQSGHWPPFSRRNVFIKFCGIGLAASGLFLFALIQTKDNYKFVHSAWHTIIALSLLFLLPSKRDNKDFESSSISSRFPHNLFRLTFGSAITAASSSDLSNGEILDDEELLDVHQSSLVDFTQSSTVFQPSSSLIETQGDVDLIVLDQSSN